MLHYLPHVHERCPFGSKSVYLENELSVEYRIDWKNNDGIFDLLYNLFVMAKLNEIEC